MHFHPDKIPLQPKRYPFFYGWLILVLGAAGFLMSSPGQTYGFAPFTNPLLNALGLTRVQISAAYMFGTIGSALCLTYAGRLYDRYGARVIAPLSTLLLGSVLVLLSQSDRLTGVIENLLGLEGTTPVPFVLVVVLFFLLRFSGQGVLTMVSRNMMMKWFDRHRGLVTGLTGMVIAPAFSAAPLVFNGLVEGVGWRESWLLLAAIIGGGFTCIAALFYRDNPEACGLVADGPLHNKALGSRRAPDAHLKQYTLAEVRRSYSFWIFAGSLSLFGLYITAMSFHAASIFESANVARADGYRIFLYAALLSITLRPFVGWLCDRIPLKILLLSMLAGILVSALGLRVLAPGLTFWIVVAGNGLCTATIGTLSTVTWPNFYGRLHLGAISGFNMAITVFASALGPWFFGSCYALFGSYDAAALVVVGLAGLLALLALRADNPQERVPAQSL